MAESLWSYLLLAFGSLFAVLNPFAVVPPFVAMTASNTVGERKAMARRAVLIAFAVQTLFALAGLQILSFFGVSAAAFRIAGGLVLIRVAFELLQGGGSLKVTPGERAEGTMKDDISITPLAVPILCGPASITTAILVSGEAADWTHLAVLLAAITVIYASILVMLRFVSSHSHLLGETATKVSSRLMGLILVALAVQFVIEGIGQADLF